MILVQVPESLATELRSEDGCRQVLTLRGGAMDVALVVLAAGSNLVTLAIAPEAIKGSLDTVQSWLKRRSPETVVEVHGGSGDARIVVRDEADVEAAIAVIRASLKPASAD